MKNPKPPAFRPASPPALRPQFPQDPTPFSTAGGNCCTDPSNRPLRGNRRSFTECNFDDRGDQQYPWFDDHWWNPTSKLREHKGSCQAKNCNCNCGAIETQLHRQACFFTFSHFIPGLSGDRAVVLRKHTNCSRFGGVDWDTK